MKTLHQASVSELGSWLCSGVFPQSQIPLLLLPDVKCLVCKLGGRRKSHILVNITNITALLSCILLSVAGQSRQNTTNFFFFDGWLDGLLLRGWEVDISNKGQNGQSDRECKGLFFCIISFLQHGASSNKYQVNKCHCCVCSIWFVLLISCLHQLLLQLTGSCTQTTGAEMLKCGH